MLQACSLPSFKMAIVKDTWKDVFEFVDDADGEVQDKALAFLEDLGTGNRKLR